MNSPGRSYRGRDHDRLAALLTECRRRAIHGRTQTAFQLVAEIEATAKAGYQAIEPWLDAIHRFAESGGSLRDVRKRCQDLGLKVCSGIGFAAWIVSDDEQRRAGLEQMKRDMDVLAQIGGTHIAAPPAGATYIPLWLMLSSTMPNYSFSVTITVDVSDTPGFGPSSPTSWYIRDSELLSKA